MTGKPRPGLLDSRSPVLLASLGAACISSSAVLITLAHTGTATAAFFRCALAVPLLAVLAGLERRRHGERPAASRLWAVVAGLFLAVDLVLWNHAIAAVGAGIATVLGNLQVLFVTAAAWLLFRERPRLSFVLALPVVMTGVVLVAGVEGGMAGTDPAAGIGYGLATSFAYTGFLLVLRQTSGATPHVAGPLFEATSGAAAGALLLGLAFGGLGFGLPAASFWWLLLLALTSQTAGWLLITSSLPRLPAALSSLLLLLQPAASLLLAAVALGQRPSLPQIAGAVLVCGGVLAVSLSSAPRGSTARAGARTAPPVTSQPPAGTGAPVPPPRVAIGPGPGRGPAGPAGREHGRRPQERDRVAADRGAAPGERGPC
jgi:drug/metabolite transporter (DMT)-like permease